jgi:hypothetical protein
MGYIKDLTRLGRMECSKCHKLTPGELTSDVQCDHCGATFDSHCYEPTLRQVLSERRFLGRLDVVHHEFACSECHKVNAWHDKKRYCCFGFNLSMAVCDCVKPKA